MKFKALIIDDEPLACGLVAEYLQTFEQIEIVAQCHDGFEGLKAFQEHNPHLVFLDVQMPKLLGIELAQLFEPLPALIFTTAFDQYALQAFEAHAIDYLLKPFSQERFNTAIAKFLAGKIASELPPQLGHQAQAKAVQRLVLKEGAKIFLIPYLQIFRLEADGDYTKITTEQGRFMKKTSLGAYQDLLPADSFVRVHRSHIINLSQLKRINPYGKNDHVALLQNKDEVPVSRTGYKELLKVLNG